MPPGAIVYLRTSFRLRWMGHLYRGSLKSAPALLHAVVAACGLLAAALGGLSLVVEAALERLRESRPGAIVLDLLPPRVPGKHFLGRAQPSDGLIPTVVVTVKELPADEPFRLERAGAPAVIKKGPDAPSEAAAVVLRALDEAARLEEVAVA
jgi:hypothetical protein